MSGAVGSMTQRATVSRNGSAELDDWNRPGAPVFVEVGVIPCRAWSEKRIDKDDSGKSAVVEDLRCMVPIDADVQEEDQLEIRDRSGLEIFGFPVLVETKPQASSYGSRPDHYELGLRRHTRA